MTVGALVTLFGGALAVRALFDWSWQHALLFGSLVAVTGPTVIGPLVETLRLRTRVATVLEAEGVLIDPIGAILAVLMPALLTTIVGAPSFAWISLMTPATDSSLVTFNTTPLPLPASVSPIASAPPLLVAVPITVAPAP